MTTERNETLSRMELVINDMSKAINTLSNLIEKESNQERKVKLQSLAEQGTALSIALLEINNNASKAFNSSEKASILKVVANSEKWSQLILSLAK